jgi:hypothetical protein
LPISLLYISLISAKKNRFCVFNVLGGNGRIAPLLSSTLDGCELSVSGHGQFTFGEIPFLPVWTQWKREKSCPCQKTKFSLPLDLLGTPLTVLKIIIQSVALSSIQNYSLRFTITHTWSSRTAVLHQSPRTGFQRLMFSSLIPKLCLSHSYIASQCTLNLLELSPLVQI